MRVQLPNQLARDAGQGVVFIVNDCGELSARVARPLLHDDAVFGDQTTRLVDRRGSRLHKVFSNEVDRLNGSLILGFMWDKSHVRSGKGFADSSRIVGVVLPRHAIRRDETGAYTPQGVAAGLDHPDPVRRSGARPHADQAMRQVGEEFKILAAMNASSQNDDSLSVKLKSRVLSTNKTMKIL